MNDYEWECKQAAIAENKRRQAKALRDKKQKQRSAAKKLARRKAEKELCDIVYAVAWSEEGPVKIGITDSEKSRLRTLQTGCPYKLSVMYSEACSSREQSQKLEAWCHERLAAYRLEGEWFDLTVEQATETMKQLMEVLRK